MMVLNMLFKYPMKRRKKSLLSACCLLAVIYAGFQIIYFEDEYSPLQLLASVENEANRLLHFITQAQIQCNSSIATSNLSLWTVCQDVSLGAPPDVTATKGVVYSVGPGFDSGFEMFIDRNSSYHQYIFSPFKSKQWATFSNETSFVQTSIVPNDPSDFARNSFQTQTLNSIQEIFKHKDISIVKIDNQQEVVQSHELLHFLIKDSWLAHVKELHFVLQLDKVEEDEIYNWYRVLYSLFHETGFRLYHTAASNSLCLQDTIMESCKYYLSWLRAVPPKVFVLYPPAIDGSKEYEEERMREFLDGISSKGLDFFPIYIKPSLPKEQNSKANGTAEESHLQVNLAKKLLQNTHSCTIMIVFSPHADYLGGLKTSRCTIISLIPVFSKGLGLYSFQRISMSNSKFQRSIYTIDDVLSLLKKTKVNILILGLGETWDSWGILNSFVSQGILNVIDEFILHTSIFQHQGRSQPILLRRKFSVLKQIHTLDFVAVDWEKNGRSEALLFAGNQEMVTINFVKSRLTK